MNTFGRVPVAWENQDGTFSPGWADENEGLVEVLFQNFSSREEALEAALRNPYKG